MENKRLKKELTDIMKDPPFGISADLKRKDDLYTWVATMTGPEHTPYEGGIFILNIAFNRHSHPFKPPTIIFVTPIYHCNINRTGDICLDILKDNWSPALTIDKVLLSISSLLAAPNPNDPLVPDLANLYMNNRAEYDRRAREFTREHAIKN